MQKIICLIGGTGFVGQHLLKVLLTDDSIKEIRVLTRNADKVIENSRIKYIQGDLRSPKSLETFIVPKSIVINLGYLTEDQKQNIHVIHHLAIVCLNLQVEHLIHLSTAVVAGEVNHGIIDENTKCQPMTDYEKIKYQLEKILIKTLEGNLPLTILRPTAIFGVGGKNLLSLMMQVKQSNTFTNRLKLTLQAKRRLNLVAVSHVCDVIQFVISNRPGVTNPQIYIISDDECSENRYEILVQAISETLSQPVFKKLPLPFFEKLLPMLLKLKGLSNSNPKRIYLSERLQNAGFIKQHDFMTEVKAFLQLTLTDKTS